MRKIFNTSAVLILILIVAALTLSGCLRNAGDGSGANESKADGASALNTEANSNQVESPGESGEPTTTTEPATAEPSTSAPDTEASSQTEPPANPSSIPEGDYVPKVMMYHLILDEVYSYENLFVRPSEFEAQLTMIDERKMEYMFANDWHKTAVPSVIITLDDGYEDNYTEMFPILKAHGARATIFVVTDLIGTDGYLTEEQIREMSDSGLVSIQCHTAHHNDLSYQSAEALREDFSSSISRLESITGKPVTALAYPAGSYNDTVVAVAAEFFNYAYTTKSPSNTPQHTNLTIPRYAVPRGCGYYENFLN